MKICVYGAASNDIDSRYISAGEELGRLIARGGHTLVFGGGETGLMGACARGVLEENGKLIGIAPKFFDNPGVLCKKCTEFLFTDTMRERKQLMEDLADAFIVTPGGIGTFDEFFEILTLKQLGRHNKPIAILNTNGYYDHLKSFLQNCIDEKFMNPACADLIHFADEPEDVINYIENYIPKENTVSVFKPIK